MGTLLRLLASSAVIHCFVSEVLLTVRVKGHIHMLHRLTPAWAAPSLVLLSILIRLRRE